MCLFVVTNGHRLVNEFDLLNVKIIIAYLLVLFIRRELSKRSSEDNNVDFKFLSIQFIILNFIISMVPPFVFIIFIYLFHNIDVKIQVRMKQLEECVILLNIVDLMKMVII